MYTLWLSDLESVDWSLCNDAVKSGQFMFICLLQYTVKPVFFFACPLFRKFHEPYKFAKITGHENLNIVAFQCSSKQKRRNYGVKIVKLTQMPKLRVLQYLATINLGRSFCGHVKHVNIRNSSVMWICSYMHLWVCVFVWKTFLFHWITVVLNLFY